MATSVPAAGAPPLWRHADFLKLWIGSTVSAVGSQVTALALPFTALLTLDARAMEMGLLSAAGSSPYLLVALPAGAWVDRLPRRPILLVCDVGRALLVGSIPAAALAGWLRMEQLYVVAFMAGVLSVFRDVAGTAYLPSVVGRERLVEANALMTASSSAAGLAGPGLAGWLTMGTGPALAMALDAVSFLPAAAGVALIRTREPAAARRRAHRNVWREIVEGLRFVAGHRLLRPLAVSIAIAQLFGSGVFAAVYDLYVVKELGISPAHVGGLEAVRYAAFFCGTLLAAPLVRRLGLGSVAVLGALLMGAGWAPTPIAADASAAALGLLAAGGIATGMGNTLFNVNASGLRQSVTPDQLLGRMHTTFRFAGRGAAPLGALLGGLLAELLGARAALAIGVAGMLLAPALLALSPVAKVRGLSGLELRD